MNILVTLDRNYLLPLRVLMTSLLVNNPGESFDVYVASNDLHSDDLLGIDHMLEQAGSHVHLLPIDQSLFVEAPTLRYYSHAMYYRLLAAQYLPEEMDRILYLDPDMLVINPLRPLYETDLGDHLYAACIHKGLVNISKPVNQVRLSTYETEGYYNSGMLLMNLPAIRESVHAEEIFAYVKKNRQLLVLPDQDILNALYGDRITPVDEALWNYNAGKYSEYLIASAGEIDMNWIMHNTAILHYCGKRKPWHVSTFGRFTALYKHYMQISERWMYEKTSD